MAFDFKREYRALYQPKDRPEILRVPAINYVAVWGQGDPNEAEGAYQRAVSVLYAVSYTLKMSDRAGRSIPGFYAYVVPPLEGFWWQEGTQEVDLRDKSAFHWISAIRLPEFVTKADLDWAVQTATQKKKLDCSAAGFLTVEEGLCVQMMHHGPFDQEPRTVARMEAYLEEMGYAPDFSTLRRHHEIYLSDARKVPPERRRTVIRQPIRPLGGMR